MRYFLSLILTLCLMGLIFFFSARPADESDEDSGRIVEIVLKVLFPNLEEKTPEQQEVIRNAVTTVVRKGAHFTEYALLGVLLLWHILEVFSMTRRTAGKSGESSWKLLLLAVLLASLYASTDEFHQYFVPGRSCRATDVLLDTSGAFTGTVIFKKLTKLKKQK